MENAPALIIRTIPQSRVSEYENAGWLFAAYLPFPLGMSEALVEWPLDKGEPVEPIQEDAQ